MMSKPPHQVITSSARIQGGHDLFLAEVVACDVDESLLDENGKLCLEKAKLIVYNHGEYLALGKKLGTFGYSVRKKKPVRRKK